MFTPIAVFYNYFMYQVFSGHFYSLCSSKIAHVVIYKCIWCI